MSLINFLHSGDMGDIIASLATVKELCEKHNAKARIFLDTDGGKTDEWCMRQSRGKGQKFNKKCFEFLQPLIEAQPYVADCNDYAEIKPLKIDVNLNAFRSIFFDKELLVKTNQNLVFAHQIVFGLDMGYKGPWLEVPDGDTKKRKILMARSNRYHSSDQIYLVNGKELEEEGAFIGTDLEAACVKDCLRLEIPRVVVKDALELAQQIKSSEKFLVNGTLAYWLAVGQGHPNIWHELGCSIPTTYFPESKPDTIHYVQGLSIIH